VIELKESVCDVKGRVTKKTQKEIDVLIERISSLENTLKKPTPKKLS